MMAAHALSYARSELERIGMSRPLPWRLQLENYPIHVSVQTRYQDLDTLGHINNVAWGAIFEAGRGRFNRISGLDAEPGERRVIASSTFNFLADGYAHDNIIIASGVGKIGNHSWQIFQLAFQNIKAVATCDITLVASDPHGFRKIGPGRRVELQKWKADDKLNC